MALRICDMHSHLLPGIDDGAQDMDETMQAMQEAYRQGIRAVIATPHYYPERYETEAQTILDLCRQVKSRCRQDGLDIRIYPGQECFYYSELADKLDRGEILTLAGSRYVLTEFLPDCPYVQLYQGLTQLQQRGYYPILAHFERYECLDREDHLQELKNRGILLQMNFDTFTMRKHWFQKNQWGSLLRSGIVDLVGSDCPWHTLPSIPCTGESELDGEAPEARTPPEDTGQKYTKNTEKRMMGVIYGKHNGKTSCSVQCAGRRNRNRSAGDILSAQIQMERDLSGSTGRRTDLRCLSYIHGEAVLSGRRIDLHHQ